MLFGVLEQLLIVQDDEQALILREQPRAAWLLAFGLGLAALNMALFGLELTAWGAVGLALLALLLARGRWLIFDSQARVLRVEWRAWWGVRLAPSPTNRRKSSCTAARARWASAFARGTSSPGSRKLSGPCAPPWATPAIKLPQATFGLASRTFRRLKARRLTMPMPAKIMSAPRTM